jgi:tetratricopeptide repeat protein
VAESLCRRADAVVLMGRPSDALPDYLAAADLSRRAGSDDTLARAYLGLGEVALLGDDLAEARTRLDAALAACPEGWFSLIDTRARILAGLDELSRRVSES